MKNYAIFTPLLLLLFTLGNANLHIRQIAVVEEWDIDAAIRPSGVYDRVIWQAADNARFGQFVAGQTWADVTGIQ